MNPDGRLQTPDLRHLPRHLHVMLNRGREDASASELDPDRADALARCELQGAALILRRIVLGVVGADAAIIGPLERCLRGSSGPRHAGSHHHGARRTPTVVTSLFADVFERIGLSSEVLPAITEAVREAATLKMAVSGQQIFVLEQEPVATAVLPPSNGAAHDHDLSGFADSPRKKKKWVEIIGKTRH